VPEDTGSIAVTFPPAPPIVPPLPPPRPPSTSTDAEVTPAGGVQVPIPTVQVTVTVVVPASLHVPVDIADAVGTPGAANAPTTTKPNQAGTNRRHPTSTPTMIPPPASIRPSRE